MDTNEMKDMNGTPLREGDQVATATSAKYAGFGLRQGRIIRCNAEWARIVLESGREVSRRFNEIVKVALK